MTRRIMGPLPYPVLRIIAGEGIIKIADKNEA